MVKYINIPNQQLVEKLLKESTDLKQVIYTPYPNHTQVLVLFKGGFTADFGYTDKVKEEELLRIVKAVVLEYRSKQLNELFANILKTKDEWTTE